MADLTSAGGSLSFILLGLGALGMLLLLGLAGIAFAKRRVPLTFLAMVPLLVCAIGALGAWSSAGSAIAELSNTAPEDIVAVASTGMYDALSADWFSRWVAAFLFGVGAWAAAIGAFFAGPEARLTPIAAASSALLTMLGAGIISVYSLTYGIGSGTALIALLLFSGLAVAFSAVRRAQYEHAHRVAGMRFASAMCMLLSISYGSRAVTQGSRMETFGPEGLATTAESLVAAIQMWNDVAAPVITLSWIAFAFAILIAFAGFYYELGEVVERFTLVDVGLTLVLMAGLGAIRLVEDKRVDDLTAVSTNLAAAEVFADVGTDLPTALVTIDKNFTSVHPVSGGFGDVLRYDGDADTWTRVRAWTGANWDEDETLLDEVTDLSSLRPLLVMESGDSAANLPVILEQVGGSALMLLRAEEVKSDVEVPPELAYLQTTYLPLELSTERDLATELWADAGAKEVNWGPTTWYGDASEDESLTYMATVIEETGAPGLQVVIGERARAKGIVQSCLPTLMSRVDEESADTVRSEAWCHITAGEHDDLVKEAMEVTEATAPEHFRGRLGRPTYMAGAAIGAGHIPARLRYEYGGIDYCLGEAIDEGEEVSGPMQVVLRINRKGNVYADFHEKSRNTNDMALRCVKDRMKRVTFVVDEEAWPEPEILEDGSTAEQPTQTVDFILDIR